MTAPTGKRFVLLINSAPFSREYFTEFGKSLARMGASASYVLESHLSDVMGGDGTPLPDSHYFTDFCQAWKDTGARIEPPPGLTWHSLLSDFDRFLVYRLVPPLTKSGSMSYADVLMLLDAFFEKIFDEIRPDAVVYEPISNSFALAAYRAAMRRNIPFFSVQMARIPGGYIEVSPTGAWRDHEALGVLLDGVKAVGVSPAQRRIAEDYIASIDTKVPDYMQKGGDGASLMATSLTSKYVKREKFDRIVRSLRYRREHAAARFNANGGFAP